MHKRPLPWNRFWQLATGAGLTALLALVLIQRGNRLGDHAVYPGLPLGPDDRLDELWTLDLDYRAGRLDKAAYRARTRQLLTEYGPAAPPAKAPGLPREP